MTAARALASALLVTALATGCTATSDDAAPRSSSALSGSLTVLAAASLTGSFTKLAADFEAAHPGTRVRLSFGASSTLAQQVLAGAPADLFASASATTMTQVTDAGAASDPRTFATNVAEVAVSPGSASKVRTFADLASRNVTVALCQPQVPCGALAQKVLAKANVTVEPVTQGLDVKSTLAYVTSGQVDAAIVYVTDVVAAGSKVVGVPVPADVNASTAYLVARVKGSRHAALAQAFEDYVLSSAGQAVLAKAGFEGP